MGDVVDQYRVRVRGKTNLWGGQAIPELFAPVGYLTVRNEEFGETVTLTSERPKNDGSKEIKDIGKIGRGETYTVKLNELTAVSAVQDDGRPTFVTCTLLIQSTA
ncbi:hypothetical protein TSA1_02105 [Bradyrhizobium nitroreducens]|uniref:Uncharacterized protein n=1 Tax=Bradyrhizobium nitroreducens TaxID=709803 RepID=A0A2M6U511_9BRAD|nr:hypothetical protein [Bradyrhizobium nitroreducens]PIS99686.1 hypothetical protein TSA1_02105 [Bradyrhizobium nitroreducens]